MHNMKHLGDDNDFYCIIDGMQLIDCKENFKMNIYKKIKLDQLSFVILPRLWEAA